MRVREKSLLIARQPMDRLVQAESIAASFPWPVGDAARFVAGAVHVIDDGRGN